MTLTNDNVKEWLLELSNQMLNKYNVKDFSNTLSESDWLEDYLGYTIQDTIDSEIQYWEE